LGQSECGNINGTNFYWVWLKPFPDKNCNFAKLAGYSTTKFCTIILHYYWTFYKILLIYMYLEMARSEIQNMISVSRQPAKQNMYLTTYQNKNNFSQKKTGHFVK